MGTTASTTTTLANYVSVVGDSTMISCAEANYGTGFIMYSDENVHTRFGISDSSAADHFVCARFAWFFGYMYDDGTGRFQWFTKRPSDILMAEVNYNESQISSDFVGLSGSYKNMTKGYAGGDLVFSNASNGNFEVTGTGFFRNNITTTTTAKQSATKAPSAADEASRAKEIEAHIKQAQIRMDGAMKR